MTTAGVPARAATPPTNAPRADLPFISREPRRLNFNERVLYPAKDPHNPILERSATSPSSRATSTFFQVHVAGLKQQVAARHHPPRTGSRPQSSTIRLVSWNSDRTSTCPPPSAGAGEVGVASSLRRTPSAGRAAAALHGRDLPGPDAAGRRPSHPFPYISDLSLSLAVTVREPGTGQRRFARVKVPPSCRDSGRSRPRTYILLERVIAANLDTLFPGMEIASQHLFRVTRNADVNVEEDEADDLLLAMEEELRDGASATSCASRSSAPCRTRRAPCCSAG